MFQWFGWVELDHGYYNRQWDEGKISSEQYDEEINKMIDSLRNFLNEFSEPYEFRLPYKIIKGMNGHRALHFSQLRNHNVQDPLEVLAWIKENAPFSYGLLYIWDDEDPENQDNFIVYRLARNEITKFKDSLLSPCLKTLEDGLYRD